MLAKLRLLADLLHSLSFDVLEELLVATLVLLLKPYSARTLDRIAVAMFSGFAQQSLKMDMILVVST